MSVKIVTASLTSTVITLVLASVDGLEVGEAVRVYNTGEARIDGRHFITTITAETKTITTTGTGPDIPPFNPLAASLVELTTWVDDETVELFLGFDPTDQGDIDFLSLCVEAANDFGYRRRAAAGYVDSRTVIPNPSAKQGVILYAAALYRERGSIDSFQSFNDQVIPGMTGSMGQIMRLLGINRPAVG